MWREKRWRNKLEWLNVFSSRLQNFLVRHFEKCSANIGLSYCAAARVGYHSSRAEKWATQTVKASSPSQTGNRSWALLVALPTIMTSVLLFCFFFFLLPFRLSSTRTRSTLAPCPPTLSVTSRRGRWMSTRTRWRGNNKARKVCLTVDARGAEPRPQLGLGFICLALFSLLVLFSCPEGGRQSLARLSLYGAYQKSFFLFLRLLKRWNPAWVRPWTFQMN